LLTDHPDLFAKSKDKKEDFCAVRIGAVLEHSPRAGMEVLQKKEKK